jgi:hypothetical protein
MQIELRICSGQNLPLKKKKKKKKKKQDPPQKNKQQQKKPTENTTLAKNKRSPEKIQNIYFARLL